MLSKDTYVIYLLLQPYYSLKLFILPKIRVVTLNLETKRHYYVISLSNLSIYKFN